MENNCSDSIAIEVAYGASVTQQTLLALTVRMNTTVQQAIKQSGILTQHPDIDLKTQKVGVFSRTVPLDYCLKDGDRIEIYRALNIDPKTARRNRVTRAKGIRKQP